MTTPSQSWFSHLFNDLSHLHCSTNVFIFNFVFSCYSQGKSEHFHLCHIQLCLLIFVVPAVSKPYIMLGRTTVWWIFPFTVAGTLLSHNSPDIFLHAFHPAFTRFLISLVHPASTCTIEPRHLNSSTLGTSVPPIITVGNLISGSFAHKYSVLLLLTFIPLLSKEFLHLSKSCRFLLYFLSLAQCHAQAHARRKSKLSKDCRIEPSW